MNSSSKWLAAAHYFVILMISIILFFLAGAIVIDADLISFHEEVKLWLLVSLLSVVSVILETLRFG